MDIDQISVTPAVATVAAQVEVHHSDIQTLDDRLHQLAAKILEFEAIKQEVIALKAKEAEARGLWAKFKALFGK